MYGKSVLFSRVVSSAHCRKYASDGTKRLLEFLAGMPKANSPRISEAQRQRQQIAKKSEKYGPSSVYLQVLGSGARGAPNTLYLFTDQKRYLFNCGEQTQRLAHEHKVKLSRLDHIFITSKTWRNIGGLPGLSLTLQDVGVPTITLHGPEGLDELYNATRRFVIMKDMNVTMAKCGPSHDFEDNVMTVKYVVLKPNIELVKELKDLSPVAKKPKTCHQRDDVDKAYEQFIHDDTDYYKPNSGHEQATNKTYVKERAKTTVNKPSPPSTPDRNQKDKKTKNLKVLEILEEGKIRSAVCYICILKKRLGTLDLAKCVELGVKPGPMLGQLKNGHDVVLEDGTLILSKDVKTPDDPGPVFIVLEVPDITYLREQEFSAHFANGTNPVENIPTVVVHFTPPEVFHNKEYQDFIAKFGPSTRHIILNAQNSCLGSEAVHRTQHKLHLLDPDIFPLLKDVSVPAEWSVPALPKTPVRLKGMEELKNKIAIAQFQNILHMESSGKERGHPPSGDPGASAEDLQCTAGKTLTVFHLRPKKQLDRSSEPKLHIQDYIHETMDVDGFVGSLEQFRRLVDNMRYAKAVDANEYPKVVFLGTGSCIPSKTRNTSAIALHVDENRSILLDCGEGTFGQLVRFYGPKRVNSFLRTLKAIYISHLHADHHIGLIGVLQARRQAFEEVGTEVPPEPVYLIAPGQIATWLTLYDQQFERIKGDYNLIPNQNLVMDGDSPFTVYSELTPGMLSQIGATQIRTCIVPHCPNAFGVCVDIGPHRITYSGDTLPCEALVKLGANSTLLIHEATMEDELATEARVKMHSTTTQAIDIGRKMNAKFTVLTHFSQRYARLPRLNAKILHDNTSVGIAFDNMQITMSDLDLLPHMYAPLQLMFAEHCVEMELKAAHRARQKQRASKGRTDSELASASSPDVSHTAAEPLVGTSNIKASETMSYYRPYYKDSHSSRLRAEAWSLNGVFNSPKARRRRRAAGGRPPPAPSGPGSLPPPGPRAPSGGSTVSSTGSPDRDSDHPTIAALAAVTRASSATNDSVTLFTENTSPKSWPFARSPDSARTTPSSASPVSRSPHPHPAPPAPSASPTRKPQDTASTSAVKEYGKPLITNMKKKLTLIKSFPQKATLKPPEAKHPFSDKVLHKNRLQKPIRIQKAAARCRFAPDTVLRRFSDHFTTTGIKATGDRHGSVGVTQHHPYHSPINVRGSLIVSSENELGSLKVRQPHRGRSSDFSNLQSQAAAISKTKNASPEKMKPPAVKGFDRAVSRMKTKDLKPVVASGSNVSNQSSPANQNHGDKKTCQTNRSKVKENLSVKTSGSTVSSASNGDAASVGVVGGGAVNQTTTPSSSRSKLKSSYIVQKHFFSVRSGLDNNHCEKQMLESKQEICEMKCMSARHSKPIPNYKLNSFAHFKGFTPQLEDIKSSFVLLNTRTQRLRDMARKQTVPISWKKPEPLNEEERRKSILQVKSKFQSKKFWQDQKYENIEGLNWISWK